MPRVATRLETRRAAGGAAVQQGSSGGRGASVEAIDQQQASQPKVAKPRPRHSQAEAGHHHPTHARAWPEAATVCTEHGDHALLAERLDTC